MVFILNFDLDLKSDGYTVTQFTHYMLYRPVNPTQHIFSRFKEQILVKFQEIFADICRVNKRGKTTDKNS